MDTIFALATARGRAGVAVIRISGTDAFVAARRLCGPLPEVGTHRVRRLRDEDGALIDEALVLVFEGPRSFTGEDVVELHVHGSVAVVAAVERCLGGQLGLRPAEAGEFTRRALLNDRLDIAQVEGLGDLLSAETDMQRRVAMRLFDGRLGEISGEWRRVLLRSVALVEAVIDFADEEVPEDVSPEVVSGIELVRESLSREASGTFVAERLRDGFEVAIIGPPNAGKSTLLNHIAGREVAITSEVEGTTRDVLEVRTDLKGLPVTFLDTAGLRQTEDSVEKIGVARTRERAVSADLRIFLKGAPAEELEGIVGPDDIVVLGKSDVDEAGDISGRTGEGVDALLTVVHDKLAGRVQQVGTATHRRHQHAMERAVESLDLARSAVLVQPDCPEIAAEHLRDAIRSLDSLTGRIDVEAVLGEIFSSFCIGK
jgi:tRNA modification GTPase